MSAYDQSQCGSHANGRFLLRLGFDTLCCACSVANSKQANVQIHQFQGHMPANGALRTFAWACCMCPLTGHETKAISIAHAGHVLSDGSFCISALASSGKPGTWEPDFCVEGILVTVINAMYVSCSVYTHLALQRAPF